MFYLLCPSRLCTFANASYTGRPHFSFAFLATFLLCLLVCLPFLFFASLQPSTRAVSMHCQLASCALLWPNRTDTLTKLYGRGSPNGIFLWKEHFCFETAVIWVVWETTTMFNILPFPVYMLLSLLTPQFAHCDTMLLAAPNKGGRRQSGASPFYI